MPDAARTTAPVARPSQPSSASSEELREKVASARAAAEDGSSVLLACDPSVEGVLSSIGLAYLAHLPADRVRLARADACQARLDEVVIAAPPVEGDDVVDLAWRVWRGFEAAVSAGCRWQRDGRCSGSCRAECTRKVLLACASDSPSMPETVHRYVRLAFDVRGGLRSMSASPDVLATDALARRVSCECEKTRQFVRFSRLSDGSFFSAFRPSENTVPLVAQHFASRMGTERFCLVDPIHRMAALHEKGARRCQVTRLDQALADELASRDDLAPDERYVRAMWKRLYVGLTLEGRGKVERGYDLRTHLMPRRFWAGLTELDPYPGEKDVIVPERYSGRSPILPEAARLDSQDR